MLDTKGEELVARQAALKAARNIFDQQWEEVKRVLWPDGGTFTTELSPGVKTNLEIFDMSPALCLERGSAALETYLTPRTQQWHRLIPSVPELAKVARVKQFFEQATNLLFQHRNAPRAKFWGQIHETWKSQLAWGNAAMYVSPLSTGGISYSYTHIGSAWMDTGPDGLPDTIFRVYPLTARNALARWGEGAPQCAKDAVAGNKPDAEHQYLHAVFPNPNFDPGSKLIEHAAFCAYEIAIESKQVLEKGGYHELPYMWSRYTVSPGEKYGRGPGMLVLPDVKTLQEMKRIFLRTGQKAVDPPLLTTDDGVLGRGDRKIRLQSGRITPGGLDAQGRPLVAPLVSGARWDLSIEMTQEIKAIIREAFLVDMFEILVQPRVEMTATEVLERSREKGQLLAPVIGRQQSELLGPMIDRELKILQRQGKMPPLPPELVEAAGEYEIEYESDATRMQKASEVTALVRTLEAGMLFFQANPSLLEIWDQPATLRTMYEVLGGSSSHLRSPEEFQRIVAAAAQAAAQRQLVEDLPPTAKGVRDIASARREMQAA